VIAHPKQQPVRSEAYLREVAKLPCINCCSERSQAAHPNTGKGMGTKADDRRAFPLCADAPGQVGCHTRFDQGAMFGKAERRRMETLWGAQTRAVVQGMGNWPKGLPTLIEEGTDAD